MGEKKDFFVSYTGNDVRWANWVAETLEDAGYSTVIQDRDFRAGEIFIDTSTVSSNPNLFVIIAYGFYFRNFCNFRWLAWFG